MSEEFLKAALPLSCSRTGRCAGPGVYRALRWSRFHPATASGAAPDVDPCALTGRRGARRSFWDAGPQGLAVGAPRQKVCGPIPLMCLVPSAGLTVTATTEPRGAVVRELRSSLKATCPKLQGVKSGIPGCAP